MPSSPADDSGNDGMEDDDIVDDDVVFRPPLPPEDRLWRHPSEVAMAARAQARSPHPPRSRFKTGVGIGLGMMALGATFAVAIVVAAGGFQNPTVQREDLPDLALGNEHLSAIAARTMPSVVGVTATAGDALVTGNAVAVRDDGYLLTTASLIDGADDITVHTHDGQSASAHLIGTDEITDLAVLHAPSVSLPAAEMGSADELATGDEAYLLGWKLESHWAPALSVGTVTATGTRFVNDSSIYHGMVLIHTDDTVSDPGRPLFNDNGALIGLTSGFADNGTVASLAAVTPIDVAVRVAHQLIESGRATDVWLGVGGSDLDGEAAQVLGLDGGARVSNVRPDSPAASAGLHDGDVIIDVDGERVQSMSDLIGKLRERLPGDEIVITVLRDDIVQHVSTTLIERVGSDDAEDAPPPVEVPPVSSAPPASGGSTPGDPAPPTAPTTTAPPTVTPPPTETSPAIPTVTAPPTPGL